MINKSSCIDKGNGKMKKHRDIIVLGLILVGLSIVLHGVHYVLFKDMHHIMIFLIADLAFIPLDVFFVSLVLEKVIDGKEKAKVSKKMDMLIGMFFTEVGNSLLGDFVKADNNARKFSKEAAVCSNWVESDFQKLANIMKKESQTIDKSKIDYSMMLEKLNPNKHLFITLLSNPILLEHDDFSDLLMTIFHLHDELKTRLEFGATEEDIDHLKFDAERSYTLLASQWVLYMLHLKNDYPYLYVTAINENPYSV